MTSDYIHIKGARVHNLKNIDLKIPGNQLIVITGLSGSGKSSLAFDTLYAEGQRRYVESLSAYARQFLGKIDKPEVDFIKGIPPAIAIEQKVNSRNPRSTVGTSTEIYDYLKLLFAGIGKTYSPISNTLVKQHRIEDVLNFILSQTEGLPVIILSKVKAKYKNSKEQLEFLSKQGFSRIKTKEGIFKIFDVLQNPKIASLHHEFHLVIDRIKVSKNKDTQSRIADSLQTAFYEGNGKCAVMVHNEIHHFSNRFEADGISFEEPSPHFFSFNNPAGACPTCEGFGKIIGIDEDLVIPDKSLSIYSDAIACWRGEKMQKWKKQLVYAAEKSNFPIHIPFSELSNEQKLLLWSGNKNFKGLNAFFTYLEAKQYKIQYRVMLSKYRGKTVCPDCKGGRLRKETDYVKINGKNIRELVAMPIRDLNLFFKEIELNKTDRQIAKRLLTEIKNRLDFLCGVGLNYLTLNRLSNSLSGGESQRINLATSLGSSLVGSLYILDEPSIGLHSCDTNLLIKVLKQLRDLGNTVIVVEHDEEIIKAADHIIDIGPHAGRFGGEVVWQGKPGKLQQTNKSLTTQYLLQKKNIPVPKNRRRWNNYIEILGARENNLKNINVKFPLNIISVISGISGSGKSSLVKNILYPALKTYYDEFSNKKGNFDDIKGDLHLIKNVEFVNQNPIGKSSRSNPVTYLKAYDEIRKLFASQKSASYQGFKPSHFSFNIDGGRCDMCRGEGVIKVEMQFMADIYLQCESCKGKRFKDEVLEICYKNKNIHQVLDMTVNEAIEFFHSEQKETANKKIIQALKPLVDVGLGYIKLGQSSSTLSGGESQRVKLAYFLSKEKADPCLFIFDEPTTGLHFHDIHKLMDTFNALVARGHTLVIIEHNMEIIKNADRLIELGPEGGEGGGQIIFEGTPEEATNCKKSITGKFLKNKLQHKFIQNSAY